MGKNKRRKHFKVYKKHQDFDNVVVSHGYKTHSLKEAKSCLFCQKVFSQFEKDKKSGRINRIAYELQEKETPENSSSQRV